MHDRRAGVREIGAVPLRFELQYVAIYCHILSYTQPERTERFMRSRDYNSILAMPPKELLDWAAKEFLVEIPGEIVTAEDMDEAARLLLQLSNSYSYLCALLSYAKISAREAKRYGEKSDYEDMVDRRDVIQNVTDCVKQLYAAVSRSVTIRIENNQELRMTACCGITQRR